MRRKIRPMCPQTASLNCPMSPPPQTGWSRPGARRTDCSALRSPPRRRRMCSSTKTRWNRCRPTAMESPQSCSKRCCRPKSRDPDLTGCPGAGARSAKRSFLHPSLRSAAASVPPCPSSPWPSEEAHSQPDPRSMAPNGDIGAPPLRSLRPAPHPPATISLGTAGAEPAAVQVAASARMAIWMARATRRSRLPGVACCDAIVYLVWRITRIQFVNAVTMMLTIRPSTKLAGRRLSFGYKPL